MNPNPPEWDRLVAAARRAPDVRDTAAPFGFATRVAALAQSAERPGAGLLFQKFSLRAMGLAAALAAVAVAANFSTVRQLFDGDRALPSVPAQTADDPTSDLVDLASS